MSYILEALKRSQQERELGRVPTLDTATLFDEETLAPARPPWHLVAVGLAAVAVAIALYAALRGPASPDPALRLPAASEGALGSRAPDLVAAPALPDPDAVPLGAAALPESTPDQRARGLARAPESASPEPPLHPPTAAPLVEPPPPKRAAQADPLSTASLSEEDVPPGRSPGLAGASPEISDEETLDPAAEAELQRQLDAELGPEWYGEEDVEPDPPTAIPRDLIDDIESFKRQVRQGRGKESEKPKPTLASLQGGDPTKLRLTRDQQAALPPFLMTVHVFDPDAGRRFVLVNGLKYREGDKTREGLQVERILAEGAVLSHRGNPFFVHR